MPQSPENPGFTPEEEKKEELPEWAKMIEVNYRTLRAALSKKDHELGTTTFEASYKKEVKAQIRKKFYHFIDQAIEEIPEAIPLYKGFQKTAELGTDAKQITLSARFNSAYYLPKTNEKYEIRRNEEKYFPDSPQFIGFEEARKRSMSHVYFRSLTDLGPQYNDQGLGVHEINVILEHLKGKTLKPETRELVEELERNVAAIEVEEEATKKRLEHEHAEILRTRIFNLVNSIEKDSSRELPDRVEAGSAIHGTGNVFLLPHEKRMVVVPKTTRTTWTGKEVKEYDFNKAVEATDEEWVHSDLLSHVIMNSLPEKIREMIMSKR